MVSVRRSRINQLVSTGDIQAKKVQALQRSIDRLLSTTQVGITCSSLALGWLGTKAMAPTVATWLNLLPLPPATAQAVSHSLSLPLTFLLIAYLQIVLGELSPKAIALLYPEQTARLLAPPSWFVGRLLKPIIWFLNQSNRWFLRLVGIEYTSHRWYDQITAEELQLMIATSSASSGWEAETKEILSNVLEFGDVSVGAVMVPRTSIHAIARDATFQRLLNEVAESGHSRYPVIGESLDEILGLIHFKELAVPLAQGILSPDSSIAPWIQPAQFASEYLTLDELLSLMQQNRQPMLIVVDEFGGTAGLVTLEDVIAEIIGNVHPFESEAELDMQVLDDYTAVVQAQMYLEVVNDLFKVELPLRDEYQTLGGFLLFQFQRIPLPGETLYYKGIELTVISTEGPRLHRIQIRRPTSATATAVPSLSPQVDSPVSDTDRP